MPQHDIRANLVFDPKGSQHGFNQAAAGAHRVERAIGGAQNAADSLLSKLFAIGSAYVGFNTAFSVFSRLTSSAIRYSSSLEATKIGLSSVMAAVEEVPWERATKMAESAFERIKRMSLTSPGSAQDMFGIFNGIVGPVRAAGAELETVYQLTNDTTLAAAALGVDFQQASRDINMMARGTAGVDVKLFSLLKSTGAIKETTEEWNKSLTGMQRVEKLGAALKKFAGSGEAFGTSWVGVMSSLEGFTDELKRTTFQPLMKAITATVGRLNTVLDKQGERIAYSFNFLGTSMARFWESTFGRLNFDQVMLGLERGVVGLGKALQVMSHWADNLVQGWGRLTQKMQDSLPMLKLLGGLYLGSKALGAVGSLSGGGGAGAAAAAAEGGGRGLLSKIHGLGNGMIANSAAGALGPLAGMAANKVSGGMNYKTAALASVAFPPAALGFLFTAALNQFSNSGQGAGVAPGAFGPGGAAGGGPGLGTLVNSVSAAIVVTEHWSRINAALAPTIEEAEKATGQLAVASGRAGMAVGRIWGQIEVFGAGLITMFAPAVSKAQEALAGIMDHVTIWADRINYHLAPAFDYAISKMGEIAAAISRMLTPLANFFKVKTDAGEPKMEELHKEYDVPPWALGGSLPASMKTPETRKPSSVTNVNASGARVTIKQEFGNQDPDRIVSLMMLDLEKQAESRLSSAFAGAFTR